ncbi:MAG: DUF4279 domain-containing protein [Gammaproteobacteria bacterium]
MATTENRGIVILRLRHSDEDVFQIGEKIGLPIATHWQKGDAINRGPELEVRTRQDSYWSTQVQIDDRGLTRSIDKLIDPLLANREVIRKFVSRGGDINIYLQLNGKLNTGDSLPVSMLRDLSDLGVSLDIEVFPNNGT